MNKEGLLYDPQSNGFLHIYSDGGKLIIDRQSCLCDHFITTIVAAD